MLQAKQTCTIEMVNYELINTTYVQSSYDKRWYNVKKGPSQESAANTLAKLREKLEVLIKHILEHTDDPDWHERIKRVNLDELREAEDNVHHVAYTINKGEAMYFCVRENGKDDSKISTDLNTLFYVAIHEIAHVVTKSVGHTEEFWKNQEILEKYAADAGVYTKVNYSEHPKSYCGVNLREAEADEKSI